MENSKFEESGESFDELNWLKEQEKFRADRYDLTAIEALLIELCRPEKGLRFVHIAGTNGKGSVAKFCSASLVSWGKKTGLFISPHVLDFRERIQINDEFIAQADLISLIGLIRPIVEKLKFKGVFCSCFDIIFAIALKYFNLNGCEFVVVETGMGGRLDSTNIIPAPEVAIITKIGFDHVKELGGSLEKIAFEKAGIIKKGSCCVCSAFEPAEAFEVVERICETHKVRLVEAFDVQNVVCGFNFNLFDCCGYHFETKLCGPFQIENAAVAITALFQIGVSRIAVQKGLKSAFWPARFEKFKGFPTVILDGAHNEDGFLALSRALQLCQFEPKVGVLSMLKTKDYNKALKHVKLMGLEKIVLTQMSDEEVVEVGMLKRAADEYGLNAVCVVDWREALNFAKNEATFNGAVVVFGSLYFAAQVRRFLVDGI